MELLWWVLVGDDTWRLAGCRLGSGSSSGRLSVSSLFAQTLAPIYPGAAAGPPFLPQDGSRCTPSHHRWGWTHAA
jgi:hypothetical protein